MVAPRFKYHGTFASDAPIVFLDQNVAMSKIADQLAVLGYAVIRTYNNGSVQDSELMKLADERGALMITLDSGFMKWTNALVYSWRGGKLKSEPGDLLDAVNYVYGKRDNPPRSYSDVNYGVRDESKRQDYRNRIDLLRERFGNRNGDKE